MPKPRRTFVDLSRLDKESRHKIQIAMWKEERARKWRREGLAQRIANKHNDASKDDRGMNGPVYYDVSSGSVTGHVTVENDIITGTSPNLSYMKNKPYGLLLINCSNMKWTCTRSDSHE